MMLYFLGFFFYFPARPAAQFCGSFNIFSCCLPGRLANSVWTRSSGQPSANGISIGISISLSISISSAISQLRRGLFEANELPWQLGRAGEFASGMRWYVGVPPGFSIYILLARIVSCQKKLRQVITI